MMTATTIALVSHVMHVGEAHHPWRAAPIERLNVLGHTPSGVRVAPGTLPAVTVRPGQTVLNRPDHLVYCLATEETWAEAQQIRDAWQATLERLAGALRELGRYDEQLAAAGKGTANPLTPSVIHLYLPPDRYYAPTYFWTGDVPEVRRAEAVIPQHRPTAICAGTIRPGQASRCSTLLRWLPRGVAGPAGTPGHLRSGPR